MRWVKSSREIDMAATNFKTENNIFRKLIGNGLTYCIPRFQRDYSWTADEWEDLWLDLLGTLQPEGEPSHYMGYLVLQSADDKTFAVIDGQQRLTTLSIIILAILKNLQRQIDAKNDAEANQQRLQQIRQAYIGYLDPVTLVSRPKLTLNRNNNDYYQNYLVTLGHLPVRGFRSSEHLLRKAFEWFDKRVADYIKPSAGNEGMRLAQLAEDISDRLFFTVITVTDELNAYKVFETLNARGVRLSATDLLKNYLFSVLDRQGQNDHELRNLEDRWEAMVGRLGAESFPDFLRVHWNSRRSFARQAELFKTIRSRIDTREAVFQLLRDMEQDLDAYLALSSPEASDWPPDAKILASTLRTFNVRQPYPLLLAAKRQFNETDFIGLLRACVVISMRFNVIGSYSTAEQERTYNAVAERIAKVEITALGQALPVMSSIYPNDAAFRAAFAEKTIRTTLPRNNRVVRYILCALEKHLSGVELSFTSDSFNVEHVLPQRPQSGWDAFSDEEADALAYRLGNMTLLQSGVNKDLGNVAYGVKRPVYQDSQFAITRKIAEDNAEWTPERIGAHQSWMANQATSIWRIGQLG
ncbi:DUF262 domain-containing HNH endonuclease family protein [Candidatus Methylospira mobilis]|uniref:DUF262 domain-containing protein n=1 Tax=Candidatus Methylospira mobilis TaxID=1808979 RepID=UPI0028EF321F|nr:DUF262 domain-containing HNH endonuclease family protein [Candidatus Methylospira mobilis]WNV04025.1 DUF262 domain-containing HNH endonuclease family protein [Candidatus Methylospira mobilis]